MSYGTRVYIYGTKYVKLTIPTGSYIDVLPNRGQQTPCFILNDTLSTVSSNDDYCQIRTPKPFTLKADERQLNAHGIAVCKSQDILVCLWNRKFKEQSAGKVVKLFKRNEVILEIEPEKNIPLYVCPTYITETSVSLTSEPWLSRTPAECCGSVTKEIPEKATLIHMGYAIIRLSTLSLLIFNVKLHVVDKDGAFLYHVTFDGVKMPRALCIDKNDSVYVGEWNSQMQSESLHVNVITNIQSIIYES